MQLPPLHRCGIFLQAWTVGGTAITVRNRCRGRERWELYGYDADSTRWLMRHNLADALFVTRTDALRSLAACAALEPLPEFNQREGDRLRRVAAGLHRTADGAWEARRDPARPGWQLFQQGEPYLYAPNLGAAEDVIADPLPF